VLLVLLPLLLIATPLPCFPQQLVARLRRPLGIARKLNRVDPVAQYSMSGFKLGDVRAFAV
jgi:hypothetical protein